MAYNQYEAKYGEENTIDKKKKTKVKKKKRKRKNWLLRVIVFIGFIVGIYYFATSEFFDINSIEVEGNKHFTVEQIKDKSGIKIGNNLFKIDIRKVRDKILKNPYFKNVEIDRKIPRKVKIKVEEREEIATVKIKRGYSVIDGDGLVLRNIDKELGLTEISGFNETVNKIGKPLEVVENTKLNETLKMLYVMKNSKIYFKKIVFEKVALKAYIYEQLICEGTPENIKDSIESGVLESTLYDLYEKGIERGTIKVGDDNYCAFNPVAE